MIKISAVPKKKNTRVTVEERSTIFGFRVWCVCVCVCVSCLVMSDSVTPWTVAHQAPLSIGFSRQEYWNGLPFPSPGDLPSPKMEPGSPALQADFFYHLSHQGSSDSGIWRLILILILASTSFEVLANFSESQFAHLYNNMNQEISMTKVWGTSSRLESRAFGKARAKFEWKMTTTVLMTNLGMGD